MRAPLPGAHTMVPGAKTMPAWVMAPLPGNEAALLGLAALAVMTIPLLWPFIEQFYAIAHEGSHAMVGSAMGFRLTGVTVDIDSTGETAWHRDTPKSGPRRTLTRFVGYLGPSAFGLGAAKLIETGRAVSVLWIATFLLVLLLFAVRKSFGLVSVPAAILLLAVVMRNAHARLEEIIIYGITWLLLLSGFKVAMAHGAGAQDAKNLHSTTHIHRVVWALLWIAGTVLAIIIGGKWLILRS